MPEKEVGTFDQLWERIENKTAVCLLCSEGTVHYLAEELARRSKFKVQRSSQATMHRRMKSDSDGVPIFASHTIPPLQVAAYDADQKLIGVFRCPMSD